LDVTIHQIESLTGNQFRVQITFRRGTADTQLTCDFPADRFHRCLNQAVSARRELDQSRTSPDHL
jgi:hypothetical protein